MKEKQWKNKSGITLVALVVTIIVLVILATVSIAMVLGNQGIFTQANEAKKITANAQIAEEENLNTIYKQLTEYINGGTSEGSKLPSTAETSPYLPDSSSVIIENSTLDTGLTVKDRNNNEWVWIIVPKSITADGVTEGDIERRLLIYASEYRMSSMCADGWYDGTGLTETEYITNKFKMLKSIQKYGGFWVGRYELGTDTIRKSASDSLVKPAVIQPDKYIYNYITCSEATQLASELSLDSNITSSQLYGIQWDLIMKFVEEKATELGNTNEDRKAKLKTDSSTWGNYIDSAFSIIKGSYSTDWANSYQNVEGTYTKTSNSNVLLTTGATTRNRTLNIYDLAGNATEWTLEKDLNKEDAIWRGGNIEFSGTEMSAYTRMSINKGNSNSLTTTRVTLYK